MGLADYYHRDTEKFLKRIIPRVKTVLRLKINNSELRATVFKRTYDYLILNNLIGDLFDIQSSLELLHKYCHPKSRIIITYYNHLWAPVLNLASLLGLRKVKHEQNWLNNNDITHFLELTDFEVISKGQRFLCPIYLPFISPLINQFIANLPLINRACLSTWVIAKPKSTEHRDYSVSIIVPARNEAGTIPRIVKEIPQFGKTQEIVFVEGGSKDHTWEVIQSEIRKHRKITKTERRLVAIKQSQKGKCNAVREGLEKASGEILMLLDSDLSVNPKDLPKFYKVLADGKGEFANGSRMIYPMEKEAMRTLNKIGNRVFSYLFTYILGQEFNDTLCGTKVFYNSDYQIITQNRKRFGDFDPFGDFELIFGAVNNNLKVVEIPVRYRERTYGSTNISRFRHGLLLLKMTLHAFIKFKTN